MMLLPELKEAGGVKARRASTVGTALKWARETLASADIPEPQADAQVLMAQVLGVDRLSLFLDVDRVLSRGARERFGDLVRERRERNPLQYILGEQEFWSLPFKVSPDVLIPRPETEILLETVLCTIKDQGSLSDGLSILDLCTGSGVLAVVLAKEIPGADIHALDLSERALAVAEENARRHGVLKAVTFRQGDLFEPLRGKGVFFDLIVSNPPYVETAALEGLPAEIRCYEPRLALDGGPDGLDIVRKIIAGSAAYLRRRGWLFLEIGDGQGKEVLKEFEKNQAFGYVSSVPDYCGIERVVRAQRI